MNSKTYSKLIAKEFGGLNRDQLLTKLEKLLIMHEKECKSALIGNKTSFNIALRFRDKTKTITPNIENPANSNEQLENLKQETFESIVNKIVNTDCSDYVKFLKIMEIADRNIGRYPLGIFNDINSLYTFFQHAEKHKIRYDDNWFYIEINDSEETLQFEE